MIQFKTILKLLDELKPYEDLPMPSLFKFYEEERKLLLEAHNPLVASTPNEAAQCSQMIKDILSAHEQIRAQLHIKREMLKKKKELLSVTKINLKKLTEYGKSLSKPKLMDKKI